MEQSAGDAGGDGDQFPLAAEDFDLAGARQFGEIDGATAADAGSGGFVGGDGRKLWEQLPRVNEETVEGIGRAILCCVGGCGDLFQSVGVLEIEFRYGRSAQ